MESTASTYSGVFVFALFILAFGVVSLGAARLLRPSRPDPTKLAQPVIVGVGADDNSASGINGVCSMKSVPR